MEERTLGRSDIAVSALGLGCWAIGGPFGRGGVSSGWGDVDDDASVAAIRRGLELGVTFFDTADVYGTGHSETILGQGPRAATATGWPSRRSSATRSRRAPGARSRPTCRPPTSGEACEASLRRLGTDRIDLYQCHVGNLERERRRRGRRDARAAVRRRPHPRLRLEHRRRGAGRLVGGAGALRVRAAPPQRARGRAGDARAVRARGAGEHQPRAAGHGPAERQVRRRQPAAGGRRARLGRPVADRLRARRAAEAGVPGRARGDPRAARERRAHARAGRARLDLGPQRPHRPDPRASSRSPRPRRTPARSPTGRCRRSAWRRSTTLLGRSPAQKSSAAGNPT